MSTNANSTIVASILDNARKGTFTGLIITKQGKVAGRGAAKQRYGDDQVHTVIYTGFKYGNLVQRSLDAILTLTDTDLQAACDGAIAKGSKCWEGRGKKAVQVDLTLADFKAARDALVASFNRTLDPTQESASTSAHVFEPLTVDGAPVRGSKVYRCTGEDNCQCRTCTGEAKAPLDGTIYLDGLRIWSKVLTPAPNGPIPASKSGGKVVARRILNSKLPVAAYVRYRLEPGQDWLLAAGGTAKAEATTAGFVGTPELLAALDAA